MEEGTKHPKVVHLTTVHSPFDVRIFHKECVSLAQTGYDVTLIQRGEQAETVKGVRIEPLPTYSSRIARMTKGVWRAISLARRHKPDIVHFHDAELIWGVALLKLLGTKVVYDVHEDLAKDLEDKAYLPRWAIAPIRLAVHGTEAVAVNLFDRISAATTSIHRRFPERCTTLVRNTPILGELSLTDPPPFRERGMNVVYLGGLAALNNPITMIAAVDKVPVSLNPRLILGGTFPDPEVEKEVRAHPGWARVDYRGWVDRTQIGPIFAKARCGLVLYKPSPNVVDAEPNKFFELLSAGVPIIASAFPVWKNLVERLGCGIAVDPMDADAVAEAIAFMLANPDEAEAMGKRGQEAVLSDYNWSHDAAKLVALYRDLQA